MFFHEIELPAWDHLGFFIFFNAELGLVDAFCSNSESSCPDVQMGFCMESIGMTQGDHEEPHFGLQIEGGSGAEPTAEDKTEFMEDDQDPEVRNGIFL